MSTHGQIEAIRKSVVVRCTAETAFRVWTERIDAWWPKGHSRSGNPATAVVLESGVGGRLYERTPDGTEYDWGKVIAWDMPRHLACHWYLGSGPELPSQVDVHFREQADGSTQVEVVHRGPELIGELWARNHAIYDAAWGHVLAAYRPACRRAAAARR